MKKIVKGGLACYQFHLIEGFSEEIDHAVFSRAGGVSPAPFNSLNVRFGIGDREENVKENRRRIMKSMQINRCISADQTHSRNVLVIDQKMAEKIFAEKRKTAEITDTDAFVTNIPKLGVMIQVADCQALLFFDTGKKILGVAHAGWRGLKQDISGVVIAEMVKLGANPANIIVGISPSLGPKNSQFTNPDTELGPEFKPFIKGRFADLWEFSRRQLIGHGIQERKIENARIDTADSEEGVRFFSHRRENGQTGRFALIAAIK
jgi:hypothetical protein